MKKPGKHIPRVNSRHDKVPAKAAAAGKPLHLVLLRSRHRRTRQGGNDEIRADHDHAGGYQAVKKSVRFLSAFGRNES